MPVRFAAMLAVLLPCSAPAVAQAPAALTLDAAFARVLENHPDLARFAPLRDAATAQRDGESQRAPLRLGLELENAPRSAQDSAFDAAETTLSLASVIETGGKREARRAVADARLNALTLEQEQRRADLLAEVARRYLELLAAQALSDAAAGEVTRRELMVDAAGQRVRAGAAPDSVRLAAEAGAARARLVRDRDQAHLEAAARRLAILWNSREVDGVRARGDLLALPAIASLAQLRELLQRSPELRRFADESRLREARLQLARSARATDIEWNAGVRRLEEDGSWAAVAGLSVPLGNARRAGPGIRAAQAELAALSLEREAQALTLEATLVEAHLRFSAASAEVRAARDELLPRLDAAERAAERAFRAGALTHLEWSQVRSESHAARREQLLAAIEAHRALIEIQRLTGAPFITGTQP
jgi:cobalt-zinc-cadmium efflux system outer membrane protein